MASIFTFDPDPPRVSSPWSTPPSGSKPQLKIPQNPSANTVPLLESTTTNTLTTLEHGSPITRLEAEPQDGPTEYKLHLLLRRRRSFVRTSTGRHISGSLRRVEPQASNGSRSASESSLSLTAAALLSSSQSRQHRLEQLTTQLLWRLQQSSPYHSSSANSLILPHLPDESQLSKAAAPGRLLPGLEESKGALYEIGVADDGTFVGLADDEMEESLNNLRAMAASLGCCVDILRMVAVGDCEWAEDVEVRGMPRQKLHKGKLRVAEAFVRPNLELIDRKASKDRRKDLKHSPSDHRDPYTAGSTANEPHSQTEQLRISLTGATMSGKSSLLGSLSTATLDNGRGKSRLSLLKHRHEIASGMTSSVTQELIGYYDLPAEDSTATCTQVINYASGNVSSWTDIHATAESGRLVFLSDSAGHPRYRRTTVRGLVGWAPHWTLLCIPADSAEDTSGKLGSTPSSQDVFGPAAVEVDLSQAHLELCLNLELSLVIVITKLDIATKTGLRQTLSKLLSALKASGKKPLIFPETPTPALDLDLHTIPSDDQLQARKIAETVASTPLDTVPIVLSSAVKGTGISKLHALLKELPIPLPVLPESSVPINAYPSTLFHVEDIYSTLAPNKPLSLANSEANKGVVIGGHLRHGILSIGDELLLGPYPTDFGGDDSDSGSGRGGSSPSQRSQRSSPVPTSRSFPGALHKGANSTLRPVQCANEKQQEWRRVRITSLRNLRLPVRTLHAGQVGSMGIVPLDHDQPISTPAIVRVRKGMVLVDQSPNARRTINVRFGGGNASAVQGLGIGNAVVLYVASVRASAKVVSIAIESGDAEVSRPDMHEPADEDDGFGFGFDDEDPHESVTDVPTTSSQTVVTFQFIASREFVEPGAQVLIIPGGGPGLYGGIERGEKGIAGLEGFVGRMVEDIG